MKHIRKILGVFATIGLIIIIAFMITRTSNGKFDGSTKESREAILSANDGIRDWKILNELEVENYLICAIASEEQCELAIFESLKDGNYGYITSTKDTKGDVISIPVRLNDICYLLAYSDIPNPDRAEITFTVDGVANEPVILDATSKTILVTELPDRDFEYEIRYFDTDGNQYE